MSIPRGIRNNNPGNIIETGIKWKGRIGDDGRFVTFDTPLNGIRALFKILRSYHERHGIKTIYGMIQRYAPKHENPTSSYTEYVAGEMGVSSTAVLELDWEQYIELANAIIAFENGGKEYPHSIMISAAKEAGLENPESLGKSKQFIEIETELQKIYQEIDGIRVTAVSVQSRAVSQQQRVLHVMRLLRSD